MTMTQDDDRTARAQVTLRLERELVAALDELARREGIDRTEVARRLLADGVARRRVESAIQEYVAGRRSAWSAAAAAGTDLYTMLDRLAEADVPYRIDPDALERLGSDSGGGSDPPTAPERARPSEGSIEALRARYRPPGSTRLLFMGESSPAGGTHFYLANSNLFRATREAFGRAFGVADPPDGRDFLDWFRDLGCWLIDVADRPVNRDDPDARRRAVDAGIGRLADTLREVRPDRVLVVVRRIAPAVRRAVSEAGLDDAIVDVLPFPIRQWRIEYVAQLARILHDVAIPAATRTRAGDAVLLRHATGEARAPYGSSTLHDVMASVLGRPGTGWLNARTVAAEIAAGDLWRRPTDGRPPPASQISARARRYPGLFQVSDLGIRLRRRPGR